MKSILSPVNWIRYNRDPVVALMHWHAYTCTELKSSIFLSQVQGRVLNLAMKLRSRKRLNLTLDPSVIRLLHETSKKTNINVSKIVDMAVSVYITQLNQAFSSMAAEESETELRAGVSLR